MTTNRVARTDIATLRPVDRRSDGTIVADAHLTKTGVFPYQQPDGSIRRELRRKQDVFDPTSLRSFEGRPVTNDHPADLLTARNAKEFAVGALTGSVTRDDDHLRGRLSIYDADTIAIIEAGKQQVSVGYTCDCIEEPGVDPMFGPYDAIQTNIRANHVAIVDRARAGQTAAIRLDGWMVQPDLTPMQQSCHVSTMSANATPAAARIDVIVRTDAQGAAVDPNDEANRNARGANDAPKAPKRQPGEYEDRTGNVVHGSEPDDDQGPGNDEDRDDKWGKVIDEMYDDDGELTQAARDKIKASNFAVPDKEKLPIHDKPHVRAAMARFGQTDFASSDEKHGAFNRIKAKAKAFGVSSEGFEKAHAGKLDRLDGDKEFTMSDVKTATDKAAKRLAKKAERKAKMDKLESDLAAAQGQIQNLTKDLETARAAAAAPRADSGDEIAAKVTAKVDLVAKATAAGAKVDAKMSDREIKVATIKHVDGDDVAADKHDAYVEALFDGALKRAKKDAADTNAGAAALAGARAAVIPPAGTQIATPRADQIDEAAAARAMRSRSANEWQQPGRKNPSNIVRNP